MLKEKYLNNLAHYQIRQVLDPNLWDMLSSYMYIQNEWYKENWTRATEYVALEHSENLNELQIGFYSLELDAGLVGGERLFCQTFRSLQIKLI